MKAVWILLACMAGIVWGNMLLERYLETDVQITDEASRRD